MGGKGLYDLTSRLKMGATKMKVLVEDTIVKDAIDILAEQFEVETYDPATTNLAEKIVGFDGLLVRSKSKATKEVIEAGTSLKVIGRAGVGVDNIDTALATEKGIPVVFSPTGSSVSVAELAIGLMLAVARHIGRANISMKAGKWEKKLFKGTELSGKTLGLIGSGRIGSETAKRAAAFGMNVISYDPYLPEERAKAAGITLVPTLEELLKTSDFISIHSLLTDETRGMIGAKEFDIMKDTAILVNCARGPIVQEEAICNALANGTIAGAALDVFEEEPLSPESKLLTLDNIVLTPHIGASSKEAQLRAGTIAAEQIKMVLNGQDPEFLYNRKGLGK